MSSEAVAAMATERYAAQARGPRSRADSAAIAPRTNTNWTTMRRTGVTAEGTRTDYWGRAGPYEHDFRRIPLRAGYPACTGIASREEGIDPVGNVPLVPVRNFL